MATMSFTAPRRFAGFALALLLVGLCSRGEATGQGTAPLVTATAASGLAHPTGFGSIQQTAIDSFGDWVVVDYQNDALYEFPAGGGAAILLAPGDTSTDHGSLYSGYGPGANPGVIIDPANNLYLEANYDNCIVMFPWDPVGKVWTGLNTLNRTNEVINICTNSGNSNEANAWAQYGIGGYSQGYFQPLGMAVGANNNLVIGTENSGNFIMDLAVTGGWSNPKAGSVTSVPINAMTKAVISIAQDPEGNIYFVEGSGGLSGLYEITAAQVAAAAANSANQLGSDAGLTRIDPNLPNVSGVITDAAGNLYVSDLTEGVFMIPNPSGTPQTSATVWLTSVPAQGEVAIDWPRNILYVPTKQTQANGQGDVAAVQFNAAEFGPSAIGKAATGGAGVVYSFLGSVSPSRFTILEDGATIPEFAITGGTCTTGRAYAANSGCVENITFTPKTVGSISAKLLMQTAQPVPKGSPDSSDSVTGYSAAGSVLTLTANNRLVAGELVQISAPGSKDALHALDGQQFNVLAAGLSSMQFEISTSDITGNGSNSSTTTVTSAAITGYSYTTVSSFLLHGTGVGANIQAAPALESAFGGGLMTPRQVAVDGEGNAYVADPGLGKVLKFPAGSGATGTPATIGTGFTAPTGVAFDHTGDIFIADYTNNSGSVYEIPSASSGLVSGGGQETLVSGLGNNLSLAVDGLGDIYIADPSNKQVVRLSMGITGQSETSLSAGFNSPSYVATDANNNLYVVDGANLFELAAQSGNVLGAPVALLNNLSGATGVAVDSSGAVYVSSSGGTVRIPSVSGTLAPAAETVIAQTVTNPDSVALDQMGNVYLADGAAKNVHLVNTNGALALPTPATLTSSTSAPAIITNIGNSALTVTGYTSTNSVDYSAADGTCVGDSPLAVGATCAVDVTFKPGAGEQGPLTGQIVVASNAVNSPVIINATGTGLSLTNSATTFTVGGTAEVINTPLSLTVAPKSGTGVVPTGQVTISYPSWVAQNPAGCGNAPAPPCVPTVIPMTNTVSASLDATGKATLTLAPVLAGSQSFTVAYGGDRVYGRSTSTVTAAIAKSAVTNITLPKFPDLSDINLPFVVPGTGGGTVPYDGSENPWQYQFNIAVNTPIGAPTGTVTVMDDSTTCPPGTSATGVGTATCVLTSYSGTACPQSNGAAVLTLQSSGTVNTAPVAFPTNCLWNVPSGITYSPVIFTHYIWPVYSGDPNFLAYTGPTKTVLQAVRGPMVQITQTGNAASQTAPPSLTVQHGSSASINLTLTSILGYGIAGRNGQLNDSNFPVSLTCDIPIPHAACAVSYVSTNDPDQVTAPDSVQIPCPSGASTTQIAAGTVQCSPGLATVTVYTNVAVGTTTGQNARGASVTLAAMFGFGMVGLFFRRRAFERGRRLLMVLLMIVGGALAVSVTACSTTNLSPQSALTSPPGTYPMTITASEVGTQTINLATGSVTIYGTQNQVSLPFVVNVTVQ